MCHLSHKRIFSLCLSAALCYSGVRITFEDLFLCICQHTWEEEKEGGEKDKEEGKEHVGKEEEGEEEMAAIPSTRTT